MRRVFCITAIIGQHLYLEWSYRHNTGLLYSLLRHEVVRISGLLLPYATVDQKLAVGVVWD